MIRMLRNLDRLQRWALAAVLVLSVIYVGAAWTPSHWGAAAERMGIEPPTLVGILDRMERDGWIRRDGDKADRRRKLIQPTAAAKPAWAKVVNVAKRVRERAGRGLSAVELAQLKRLLEVVQANLQQSRTEREAG